MLKLSKIAVTGGLACGKTSVCHFFKELGACVLSADEIVHKMLSPNSEISQRVLELFGEDILSNGSIDHKKIANNVFNFPQNLQKLEDLLHPFVRKEIDREYQILNRKKDCLLLVVEVPLLFETSYETYFDKTIAVISKSEVSYKRFSDNIGYNKGEYSKRVARQLSNEEKAVRADYTITNNDDLKSLKKQVRIIYDELIHQ